MNKDALNYSRICTGEMFMYSVCDGGFAIKTTVKSLKESRVKAYLRRDKAHVKINSKEYVLKHLVAEHFIHGYKNGDTVINRDGNPLNCNVKNLKIITKQEHGKRTGYLSRSQKITVNGIEYRSIRECAKAFFVSYQTLLDYLSGKSKKSVLNPILDGVKIKFKN